MSASEITDHLPIAIRAYGERQTGKPKAKNSRYPKKPEAPASLHTLVFDCETRTDSAQSLRFGTYQHRYDGELRESGIFYCAKTLNSDEIATLQAYAAKHGLECISGETFVKEKFYKIGYGYRATIVGFNLPFDISRIAIGHNSARGTMKGGFTFALSDDKRLPNVQVKHLSARAAFTQFAAPFVNRTNRSLRKRGLIEPTYRGHFLDCKTLAAAMLARSFSLEGLCDALSVENPKFDAPDFGGPITFEFIDYAVRDTQATWECYRALITKFQSLGLGDADPCKMYSEASLGKAGLKSMGIRPWRECQPDFDPKIIGKIMASYFGGRSEIGIRRSERQVMLCDFLSMYPTVCILMNLWEFVIAKGVLTNDATVEARALLANVTLAELQSKTFWPKLAMLVRVKPEADIFPVRTHYGKAAQPTIGLNELTNDCGQWFTLADCIASKLLTGKAPQVLEAISFAPMEKQTGLDSFKVNGDEAYAIDPARDDYYKRLIELRQATKARLRGASALSSAQLNTQQDSLKIMANATSYGIFVEMIVEDAVGKAVVEVFNGSADPFRVEPSKVEKPGNYFHPLLATLITGAARLMLAITEALATSKGLDWSFCDTDSMALAKPDAIGQRAFCDHVQSIIDWFAELNPYGFGGSILKSEDVNFSLSQDKQLEPLYCFAVSAKRYALYNLNDNSEPIIRKASAHGLGHLRPPYDETNPAIGMPKPQIDLAKAGLSLWQHDLWIKIIEDGKSDKPLQVDLSYHPALRLPAIGRYAATSPHLLRWFDKYNEGRAYVDQVKPFGFSTPLTANSFDLGEEIISSPSKRRKSKSTIMPIAPFTTDPAIAGQIAFDRATGEPVSKRLLKSYADSIRQYHLQPENKFLNGNWINSGPTIRRHLLAIRVMHIGKEANDLERQATLGYDHAAQPAYGYCRADIAKLQLELTRLCEVFSAHQVSSHGQITTKRLTDFIDAEPASRFVSQNAVAMEALARYLIRREKRATVELELLDQLISERGLRETARDLDCDPSNLRRAIRTKKLRFDL